MRHLRLHFGFLFIEFLSLTLKLDPRLFVKDTFIICDQFDKDFLPFHGNLLVIWFYQMDEPDQRSLHHIAVKSMVVPVKLHDLRNLWLGRFHPE